MKPLPAKRYEYADWIKPPKVNIDYQLEVDFRWYSVPHQLVGQFLNVRATALHHRLLRQGPARGLPCALLRALQTHDPA
jgi:hypothetical protein